MSVNSVRVMVGLASPPLNRLRFDFLSGGSQ
jgi:hypothetical protein